MHTHKHIHTYIHTYVQVSGGTWGQAMVGDLNVKAPKLKHLVVNVNSAFEEVNSHMNIINSDSGHYVGTHRMNHASGSQCQLGFRRDKFTHGYYKLRLRPF